MDASLRDLLVGRGVDTGFAAALATDYPDWAALAIATKEDLEARFGANATEQVAAAKERRDIPRDTVRRLLDECDSCCCFCWDRDYRIGVLLHHIEDHAKSLDDSYDNLIVLCPNHHSEVHRKYTIARHPYSPDALRAQKKRFADAIAAFRAGKGPAPGREAAAVVGRPATAPLPPSNFVGRTQAIADIRSHLLGANGRLALVGMGGVGKTALSLQSVHALKAEFPGGVFWVESDGSEGCVRRILRVLVAALGGDDSALDDDDQAAFVQNLLAERSGKDGRLLLAVDGVGETGLDRLKRAVSGLSGKVSFLMTTREKPAAVALDAHVLVLAPLPRGESGDLLSACSGARAAGGPADSERLLDLLGDLPLAVELVARQIAQLDGKPGFTVGSLCDRLQRFDDALLSFPGHRGIARSFALSYESMNEAEQRLFRALGMFADCMFPVDAAAAVAAMESVAAEDTMDRLVGISVLQWGIVPGRYRAHTLVHKYAGFLLERTDAAERAKVGSAYRAYFISAANAVAIRRPSDLLAMDDILADYKNAMRGAAAAGEHALVADSMSVVWRGTDYFAARSLEAQALPLLDIAIGCAEKGGDPDRVAELVAHKGRALLRLCRVRDGIRAYERAAQIVRNTGNTWDLASALQNLGQALVSEGRDLPRAETVLREALNVAERARNPEAAVATFTSLGGMYRYLGKMSAAAEMYDKGLRSARLWGNRFAEGNNLSNLGLVQLDTGQLALAERSIGSALAIALEIADLRGEGNRTGHLGRIMLERARHLPAGPERHVLYEEAIKSFQAATDIALKTSDPEKASIWLMNLGVTYVSRDQHGTARQMFSAALGQAGKLDSPLQEGQIRLNLGASLLHTGELKQGVAELRKSRDLLRSVGSHLAAHAEKNLALVAAYVAEHGDADIR